jgi:hypothetical protein
METILEKMYVTIPQSDIAFFKELIRKMGWSANSSKVFLDKYINSRPKGVDLSEDDIMAEVKAVRYGERGGYKTTDYAGNKIYENGVLKKY